MKKKFLSLLMIATIITTVIPSVITSATTTDNSSNISTINRNNLDASQRTTYLLRFKLINDWAWVPDTYYVGYNFNTSGFNVTILQEALNLLGYNAGFGDGIYGPNTQRALRNYQSANGLSPDGIAGPLTWRSLASSCSGKTLPIMTM